VKAHVNKTTAAKIHHALFLGRFSIPWQTSGNAIGPAGLLRGSRPIASDIL